ncbi:CPBP family glutamic-type intramembrane protease [Adhaeribacter aerolatus]|uniref:CPBP family glutamic-type intramembrane protease n=1 Tax=Adhaeribacter aerolatus TaxID=670289 RepID=UPI0011BE6067|nr:CPBP family glutamic-type intramembrane protease [Adhaeribacter aerolatus]
MFAAAHLPVVFQSVAAPAAGLISYIMLGNTIGGVIFGWIYWKKGLEAAFISHMFAHVVFMLAENIIPMNA